MIVFDLKCSRGHRFEGWFKDSAAFETQSDAREIPCAVCGDTEVSKALMAPNIATGEDRAKAKADDPRLKDLVQNAHKAMRQLRDHVESTHEDVGTRFPEEARKIHYGESQERGIYGEASLADAKELTEEGIEVFPLGPARNDA